MRTSGKEGYPAERWGLRDLPEMNWGDLEARLE